MDEKTDNLTHFTHVQVPNYVNSICNHTVNSKSTRTKLWV